LFTSDSDVASPVTSPVSSPVASPSSSTTLLTGFFQEISYSDTACTIPYTAYCGNLNTCIHVGYSKYSKMTATSTYFKDTQYTDAACTLGATISEGFTYRIGACVSSKKYLVRQDTSVPINVARFTMR
jgi:hypothetical protein